MDLKTHRLRHPSQDWHGVQPSRQIFAGTQPRTGNSQKKWVLDHIGPRQPRTGM